MKQRLITCYVATLVLFASPVAALAQEEREYIDARLEGYPANVALEGGSTALTWVMFIVLAVVALGGMFKNAKRTHLD